MNGKVAIISGGAGFIGFEICRCLCESGMSLAVWGSTAAKANETVQRLGKLGEQCLPIGCNVADTDAVRAALKQTVDRFGGIDVVISMQGWPPRKGDITEISDEVWNGVISSHLTGSFHMLQQSIPYLEKSSTPRVVFLAAPGVFDGDPENGLAYNVAKGGIISMTYSAAKMLAKKGITVNCLAVGGINNGYQHEMDLNPAGQIPLGRASTLDNVHNAVSFLVSEAGAAVTGQVLVYNSGEIIS
jgi:3-oxoacyl-[acyl-carrier protein] reductase